MSVKPAQLSYDIHLFTNRHGKRAVSVTLPNGKRTKRLQLSKMHERVLLEILALVRVYESPSTYETATATRRGNNAGDQEPVPEPRESGKSTRIASEETHKAE